MRRAFTAELAGSNVRNGGRERQSRRKTNNFGHGHGVRRGGLGDFWEGGGGAAGGHELMLGLGSGLGLGGCLYRVRAC
jgi:hypothetical protein